MGKQKYVFSEMNLVKIVNFSFQEILE